MLGKTFPRLPKYPDQTFPDQDRMKNFQQEVYSIVVKHTNETGKPRGLFSIARTMRNLAKAYKQAFGVEMNEALKKDVRAELIAAKEDYKRREEMIKIIRKSDFKLPSFDGK
jgi:hypothetical protein